MHADLSTVNLYGPVAPQSHNVSITNGHQDVLFDTFSLVLDGLAIMGWFSAYCSLVGLV